MKHSGSIKQATCEKEQQALFIFPKCTNDIIEVDINKIICLKGTILKKIPTERGYSA